MPRTRGGFPDSSIVSVGLWLSEALRPRRDERRIVLTPGEKRGEMHAALHGDLGTILEWAGAKGGRKVTAIPRGGMSVSVVAGGILAAVPVGLAPSLEHRRRFLAIPSSWNYDDEWQRIVRVHVGADERPTFHALEATGDVRNLSLRVGHPGPTEATERAGMQRYAKSARQT